MSGVISGCHNAERDGGTRDAAKHPTMPRTAPKTEPSSPDVSRAQAEEACWWCIHSSSGRAPTAHQSQKETRSRGSMSHSNCRDSNPASTDSKAHRRATIYPARSPRTVTHQARSGGCRVRTLYRPPPFLREGRGQSWSSSWNPRHAQPPPHSLSPGRGGDVVIFFYVQAFCFFTSQFTENTCALLLKSKKSLLQGSCQTTGPTQSLGRGKIRQPRAERVGRRSPRRSVWKSHRPGIPLPGTPRGERTAPERSDKVQTPQSTHMASAGDTLVPCPVSL